MIVNAWGTLKLSGITLASAVLGAAIDASTQVPIGVAVGVGAAVVGVAWHLSGLLRGIKDQIKNLDDRMKLLEEREKKRK